MENIVGEPMSECWLIRATITSAVTHWISSLEIGKNQLNWSTVRNLRTTVRPKSSSTNVSTLKWQTITSIRYRMLAIGFTSRTPRDFCRLYKRSCREIVPEIWYVEKILPILMCGSITELALIMERIVQIRLVVIFWVTVVISLVNQLGTYWLYLPQA